MPFLNPRHQVNELLYSHSGINERNKTCAVLPGRASIIHPDGIRPRYPQSSPAPQTMVIKEEEGLTVTNKRYYIDLETCG